MAKEGSEKYEVLGKIYARVCGKTLLTSEQQLVAQLLRVT